MQCWRHNASFRVIASSLADLESRYARALEDKILLEHELQDKASLEEEMQRMRDELRGQNQRLPYSWLIADDIHLADLNSEVSVLKSQESRHEVEQARVSSQTDKTLPSIPAILRSPPPADEDSELLLNATPPSDLLLSDLTITVPSFDLSLTDPAGPTAASSGKSRLLSQPGIPSHLLKSTSGMSRSHTSPHLSPSRLPTPPALRRSAAQQALRPAFTARAVSTVPSSGTNALTAGSTSRSKGVQMVSEMRARVKNLEMKIHTRVPRLRNPAIKSASAANEDRELDKRDSPWVYIKEATPSRRPDDDELDSPTVTARRGALSPTLIPAAAFRPLASTSAIPSPNPSAASGLPRRPASRLSALSTSTIGTGGTHSAASSVSTQSSLASSRPSTPTFLPIPVFSTAVTPNGGRKDPLRRSSLGIPITHGPRPASAASGAMPPRPPIPKFTATRSGTSSGGSVQLKKSLSGKASNRTTSGSSTADGLAALKFSRFGRERERPNSFGASRKSIDEKAVADQTKRQRGESIGRPS